MAYAKPDESPRAPLDMAFSRSFCMAFNCDLDAALERSVKWLFRSVVWPMSAATFKAGLFWSILVLYADKLLN